MVAIPAKPIPVPINPWLVKLVAAAKQGDEDAAKLLFSMSVFLAEFDDEDQTPESLALLIDVVLFQSDEELDAFLRICNSIGVKMEIL